MTDLPSKRTRRQTRSALLNDENVDPEEVTVKDESHCDTGVVDIPEELPIKTTPSRRARDEESRKKGKVLSIY